MEKMKWDKDEKWNMRIKTKQESNWSRILNSHSKVSLSYLLWRQPNRRAGRPATSASSSWPPLHLAMSTPGPHDQAPQFSKLTGDVLRLARWLPMKCMSAVLSTLRHIYIHMTRPLLRWDSWHSSTSNARRMRDLVCGFSCALWMSLVQHSVACFL